MVAGHILIDDKHHIAGEYICLDINVLKPLQSNQKGHLSSFMRKPNFSIWENKGTDQLHTNATADQCLCYCYIDRTIPLLPKPEISSL